MDGQHLHLSPCTEPLTGTEENSERRRRNAVTLRRQLHTAISALCFGLFSPYGWISQKTRPWAAARGQTSSHKLTVHYLLSVRRRRSEVNKWLVSRGEHFLESNRDGEAGLVGTGQKKWLQQAECFSRGEFKKLWALTFMGTSASWNDIYTACKVKLLLYCMLFAQY